MGMFGDNAPLWFESGFNVLPLHGKRPLINGWQEWGSTRQAQFQIDAWCSNYDGCNIGVPLGEASGVIVLDFDHDINGLHEKIEAIAGYSHVKKRGAKGFSAFYRYNGERNKRWRIDGAPVVELLSTGTQTVVPPSIHPDSKQAYVWITPDSMLDADVSDLPMLPDDFTEKVDALLGVPRKISAFGDGESIKPEMDVIKSALQFIPAVDYATWVEIGMALHHSYGDAAFSVWDSWSATAVNYDADKMGGKWSSFGRYVGTNISCASILHYAHQYGWIMPSMFGEEQKPVILIGGRDVNEKKVENSATDSEANKGIKKDDNQNDSGGSSLSVTVDSSHRAFDYDNTSRLGGQDIGGLPHHLLNAPSIVGELAAWINATSTRYQPALALAASLGAVGTIMAHRYQTPTGLRSNLYLAGIIGAGLGKDHARKCIGNLFEQCGIGDLLSGNFRSDAAMETALHNRRGICYTMTDELGDELQAISNAKGNSYEMRIMRLTKELFSSANSVYRGAELANRDGKTPPRVINQPCLSIYGTSTEGQFFDSLNGRKVVDGFLPRWLIFFGNGEAKKIMKYGITLEPPERLVERVRDILAISPTGDADSLVMGTIRPRTVDFTEGAQSVFKEMDDFAEQNRLREYRKGSELDALYARLVEHAYKIALVCHENEIVNESIARWACDLVMHLSQSMISMVRDRIGDNEYERDYLAVMKFIRDAGDSGVTKSKIYSRFQRLGVSDQDKILRHLVESDTVNVYEEKMRNNRVRQTFVAI